MRLAVLVYGVFGYVLSLAVLLYGTGFVGGSWAPKTLDDGEVVDKPVAILIDLGLLAAFAVQHSGMARQAFKARWARVIPEPAERSTYVIATSALLVIMFWQWRPLPDVVWSVDGAAAVMLRGLFWAGWAIALLATFLTDHADLFGLRQVLLFWRRQEYEPPEYVEHLLYRFVRHPLMLGFLVGFWSAPVMSEGHLLFAAVMTAYVAVGTRFEERDLLREHGDLYRSYQSRVPMLLPIPRWGRKRAGPSA